MNLYGEIMIEEIKKGKSKPRRNVEPSRRNKAATAKSIQMEADLISVLPMPNKTGS